MTTHLIHIGNSLGVRIPKAILAQVGFEEGISLKIKVVDQGLLISPVHSKRQGWAEAFEKAPKSPLIMGDFANQFDENAWEW